jgi:hypothetical protein
MTELSESITQLRVFLNSAESEINLLKTGRKSSSGHARKSLMALKNGSHALRKQIIDYQKSLPVKSRAPKLPVIEPVLEPESTEEIVPESTEEIVPEVIMKKMKKMKTLKKMK